MVDINNANPELINFTGYKPTYTSWTISKAVKDGFSASTYVYRSITAKSARLKKIPYVVCDADNTPIWDHPITKLLLLPNPQYTRERFYELLFQFFVGTRPSDRLLVNGSKMLP